MEFHRLAGQGSDSQNWMDRNLPICPLCKSEVLWEVAEGEDQLALTRWYFRCPNCKAVLSTDPEGTVATTAPPPTVANAPLTIDIRVESVQRNGDEDFVGEEFPLAELQEWASESD